MYDFLQQCRYTYMLKYLLLYNIINEHSLSLISTAILTCMHTCVHSTYPKLSSAMRNNWYFFFVGDLSKCVALGPTKRCFCLQPNSSTCMSLDSKRCCCVHVHISVYLCTRCYTINAGCRCVFHGGLVGVNSPSGCLLCSVFPDVWFLGGLLAHTLQRPAYNCPLGWEKIRGSWGRGARRVWMERGSQNVSVSEWMIYREKLILTLNTKRDLMWGHERTIC